MTDEILLGLRDARTSVDRDIVMREALQKRIVETQEMVDESRRAQEVFDKTAMLLNALGEERQMEAQSMIEGLVTRGLQSIFEPDVSFVISTSVKGKSTTTEFLIRSEVDGNFFETSVLDARGGGLVAIVSFLLRVTVLLLTGPKEKFLLLDETFAHVSEEYLPAVGEFLQQLVEETGSRSSS